MELTEIFLIAASIFFTVGTVLLIIISLYLYKTIKRITLAKLYFDNLVKTLGQTKYTAKAIILDKILNLLK